LIFFVVAVVDIFDLYEFDAAVDIVFTIAVDVAGVVIVLAVDLVLDSCYYP
jgi:hypothetical protein